MLYRTKKRPNNTNAVANVPVDEKPHIPNIETKNINKEIYKVEFDEKDLLSQNKDLAKRGLVHHTDYKRIKSIISNISPSSISSIDCLLSLWSTNTNFFLA